MIVYGNRKQGGSTNIGRLKWKSGEGNSVASGTLNGDPKIPGSDAESPARDPNLLDDNGEPCDKGLIQGTEKSAAWHGLS